MKKWVILLVVIALGAIYIYITERDVKENLTEKEKQLEQLQKNIELLKQNAEEKKYAEENQTNQDLLEHDPQLENVSAQNNAINLPESIEETQRQLNMLTEFKKSFKRYVATQHVTPKMTLELYDEFEALPDLCDWTHLKEHLVILLLYKTTRYKKDIDGSVFHILRQQFNVCPRCNGTKVLKCTECNGTGKCSKCNGTGTYKTINYTEDRIRHNHRLYVSRAKPKLCATHCRICKGKKTLPCRHCSNTGLNLRNLNYKKSPTETTDIILHKLNTLIERLNNHL